MGFGIGSIASLVGGEQAASSQRRALRNQARANRRNAARAKETAARNASQQQLQSAKILGAIEPDFAASGFNIESGSALAVMAASRVNAEVDRLNIIHGGDIRAANFISQAIGLERQRRDIGRGQTLRLLAGGARIAESFSGGLGGGGGGSGGGASSGGSINSIGSRFSPS